MPLYDGETLQARLVRGPLPCEDAVAVALQIAGGLQQAHEHGIVHRDVKPSNVMLLSDGTAKVLDFGVAKVEDVAITDGDVVLGTVAYMSPEQALGRHVDHRADVWSLGVVLYEMLTGTRPFHGNSRQALIDAILARDPEPITAWRADLPAAIDDVVRRALAKRQDERYASMSSMAADLAALAEPSRSAVRSAGSWTSRRTPRADEATAIAAGAERRWAAVVVSTVSDYSALVERLLAWRARDAARWSSASGRGGRAAAWRHRQSGDRGRDRVAVRRADRPRGRRSPCRARGDRAAPADR